MVASTVISMTSYTPEVVPSTVLHKVFVKVILLDKSESEHYLAIEMMMMMVTMMMLEGVDCRQCCL